MQTVTVLFARRDSIYKSFPACEVYDIERDASTWPGGTPVVAHPPCRLWSKLRHFSTAPLSEKCLALWAIVQVRQWGGVLEHPASSSLFASAHLPRPGREDIYGGRTIGLWQSWFGHRATKPTWLYIVGCPIGHLPAMPFVFGEGTHLVSRSSVQRTRRLQRPEISKAEREHTPLLLAKWLLDVARLSSMTYLE